MCTDHIHSLLLSSFFWLFEAAFQLLSEEDENNCQYDAPTPSTFCLFVCITTHHNAHFISHLFHLYLFFSHLQLSLISHLFFLSFFLSSFISFSFSHLQFFPSSHFISSLISHSFISSFFHSHISPSSSLTSHISELAIVIVTIRRWHRVVIVREGSPGHLSSILYIYTSANPIHSLISSLPFSLSLSLLAITYLLLSAEGWL